MMKSWQIIREAHTGSIWSLVLGIIGTAAFMAAIIIIVLLGGSLV